MKFIIEGEEEAGISTPRDLHQENTERLSCDVILISDTSIVANDVPSITTGLRGLCYMEIK